MNSQATSSLILYADLAQITWSQKSINISPISYDLHAEMKTIFGNIFFSAITSLKFYSLNHFPEESFYSRQIYFSFHFSIISPVESPWPLKWIIWGDVSNTEMKFSIVATSAFHFTSLRILRNILFISSSSSSTLSQTKSEKWFV